MLIRKTTYSSSGQVSIELICAYGPFTMCASRRVRLASLTLHLFNFPNFLARDDFILEVGNGAERRIGRILLQSPEWKVEIQATPDTARLVEELKVSSGYAITHVVRITRTDGRTFSVRDAEKVSVLLHKLVSFAVGRWTGIFGATGVNVHGAVVYEEWASRPSAPWGGRLNWFDEHHGEALSDLFAGFVSCLEDPQLGPAISAAHYWYLRSNRGGEAAGADGSLILSQAALEGLASAYLAAVGKSQGGNAAETIRLALTEMSIPAAIPKEFRKLRRGQRKRAWDDGPHALIRVRNDLVHPKKRLPIPIGNLIGEAWQLAQWYLELAILRASGYSGVYSSRLRTKWVGDVEAVPWAP
jgi:hypothetical protein